MTRTKKFRGWRRWRRASHRMVVDWFFHGAPEGTELDLAGTLRVGRTREVIDASDVITRGGFGFVVDRSSP